jgi:hypothetical protein
MFINNHMHYWFHLPVCTKDKCSAKLSEVLKTLPKGVCVHMLWLDCGGEFTSTPFLKVLQEHGVQANTTPPYTLEYNGVAKRSGCTIMEMV